MPKDEENKIGLKKWLDSLQQESWQLELLISGFSIFLLIGGWSKLVDLETDLVLLRQASRNFSTLDAFYDFSRIAITCLLTTLIFHVLLRGMWIATIGLRSVSGDIEYKELNFLPRFHNFLKQRIGSFDGYVERLERYCSVLFSLAFLIFFGLLSLALLISILNAVGFIVVSILGDDASDVVNSMISVFLLVTGLPYLLDFITVGWFKRQKWLARPYYYLYRLMGWLTLARFSRPLYYNLIDNRFGRRLAVAVPGLMLAALVIWSYEHITHAYYPAYFQSGKEVVLAGTYDDEGYEGNSRLWRPSLSSRYVNNNYLELFIPYIPINDDDELEFHYPDLVPARLTGTVLRGGLRLGKSTSSKVDNTELRKAMSGIWRISLDSLQLDVNPRFSTHKERGQFGLLYMIPAHELPVGEHEILIQKRMQMSDTLQFEKGSLIYFYK